MSPRLPQHALSVFVQLVTVLTLVASLVTVAATPATASSVTRLSGTSRITTAVQVADAGWDTAEHVLLATARDFPDAVAAAALAAAKGAPLLLTEPDALPADVTSTIDDLGATSVTILGGTGSVSQDVEDDLQAMDLTTTRVSGSDRFTTAAKIADAVAADYDVPVVALAVGLRKDGRDAWPDALAAASLAALDTPVPTLLTRRTELPEATLDALERLAPDQVVVLGGEGSVSDDVAAKVEGLGIEVTRVEGETRFVTAIEVARIAMGSVQDDTLGADEAVFVSGEDFPDALAGGALAARRSAPLLLVPRQQLTDTLDAFIRGDETSFSGGTIIGGDKSVGSFVEKELDAAISGEPRPQKVKAAGSAEAACPANSSPDCAYTYEHAIETWERLAQCESGGNWAINTGNGYYGGLQFSLSSWRLVGGQGYPHQNSKWEQMYRAELLHDRQGWGAWPACSSKLGYR